MIYDPVNFGYNRSLYLKYAKNKGDFLIMLDADEILIVKNKNFKNNIKPNSKNMVKYDGNLDYRYGILLSGNIQWKYVGVTHEYITSDEKYKDIDLYQKYCLYILYSLLKINFLDNNLLHI